MPPRSLALNHLRLEEANHRFGERVVVGIATAADGGLDPGLRQAVRVAHREVLCAAVAVMYQVRDARAAAIVDGLFEGIEDEVGAQRGRDTPAHDPTGEDVDDERHIDETAPGRDIGEVGDPELIGARRRKTAIDPISWACSGRLGARRGDPRASADRSAQTHVPHQTLDRAARHAVSLAAELFPDFGRPIDLVIGIPDPLNCRAQLVVTSRPRRPCAGIPLLHLVPEVCRRSDGQNVADRLDSIQVRC